MSENKSKTTLYVLGGKLLPKTFSFLIKFIKGLKFLKIGLAGASFAGYAYMFTWKFALLLMIAVGWHESGHVWAMKKLGIPTKGFYFIPFFGGAAIPEENFKSHEDNLVMSIMGPIFGAILAWSCLVPYYYTHNNMWLAAAGWMAFINLFNLLPINPLDGGRIIHSVAHSINSRVGEWFLFMSALVLLYLGIHFKIYLFVILTILTAIEYAIKFWVRFKRSDGNSNYWVYTDTIENDNQTKLSFKLICVGMCTYVLLIGNLVYLSNLTKYIPGADIAHEFLQ